MEYHFHGRVLLHSGSILALGLLRACIELKIKEFKPPKFMCATCANNITELRAMKFPICDDYLKALREIIEERRREKEAEK